MWMNQVTQEDATIEFYEHEITRAISTSISSTGPTNSVGRDTTRSRWLPPWSVLRDRGPGKPDTTRSLSPEGTG